MTLRRIAAVRAAWLVAWMTGVTMLWTSAVEACVVCVPYPKTTHADLLINSEAVVTARENPAKPYSFRTVEILRGTIDDAAIDVFLDSLTRRKLNLNAQHVVVLVRANAKAEWKRVSYANKEYQAFIRTILKYADSWQGTAGGRKRVEFFSEHLTHLDQTIREQAYLEVGRAPYSWIKAVADTVPRGQIRAFLADWRLIEWHSLYILMLGQSQHPDDRAYLKDRFHSAVRYHTTTNLSAWATAFVETDPMTGIDVIESVYFGNADRADDELTEVLKALSVLGSEGGGGGQSRLVDLRHRIAESYATLLDRHPHMAGWVAKDLTIWQRKALVERLAEVVENKLLPDPSSVFSVKYYLSQASRFLPFGPVN
jgi:hypothetical protein